MYVSNHNSENDFVRRAEVESIQAEITKMDFPFKVKQEEYEGYSISQSVIETSNEAKQESQPQDMLEKVRLERKLN